MLRINFLGIMLLLLCATTPAFATCNSGSFINPITDICYTCMFPFKVGGISILNMSGDMADTPDTGKSVCVCSNGGHVTVGLTASLWEPARLIETTKDGYCFPTLGVGVSPGTTTGATPFSLDGTTSQPPSEDPIIFQNQHYLIFPLFSLLNIFTDWAGVGTSCLELKSFDVAYLSEVDLTQRDELASMLIHPWALLLANPIAVLSCVPDAVTASLGLPLDALWWCMGSWGTVTPVSGFIGSDNEVPGNAGLAAKTIFKVNMDASILTYGTKVTTGNAIACDPGIDECGCTVTPIWFKSHYRLQMVRPVVGSQCIPIGRTHWVWGTFPPKNPPLGIGAKGDEDNFLWMMFRKDLCCLGYSLF